MTKLATGIFRFLFLPVSPYNLSFCQPRTIDRYFICIRLFPPTPCPSLFTAKSPNFRSPKRLISNGQVKKNANVPLLLANMVFIKSGRICRENTGKTGRNGVTGLFGEVFLLCLYSSILCPWKEIHVLGRGWRQRKCWKIKEWKQVFKLLLEIAKPASSSEGAFRNRSKWLMCPRMRSSYARELFWGWFRLSRGLLFAWLTIYKEAQMCTHLKDLEMTWSECKRIARLIQIQSILLDMVR